MGIALTTSFAGCLSTIGTDDSSQGTSTIGSDDSSQGTVDLPPVRFWLEEVSLTESEQESIDSLVFSDLSTEAQEIVRTAISEEEYTVQQGSKPPALETIRDRIEQRTGNGETLEVFLRREDTYYRVGYVDGDHIIAQ